MKFKELTCRRCGWTWTPRKLNPAACPECKSRTWNRDLKESGAPVKTKPEKSE